MAKPYLQVAPSYTPRWIAAGDVAEIVNLWHLSRTALSGSDSSRWARMNWTAKEFAKAHPEVSATAAYKDLDGLLA